MIHLRHPLEDRSETPNPFAYYTVEDLRKDWISKMPVQPPSEYFDLLKSYGGKIFSDPVQIETKPPHVVYKGSTISKFPIDEILLPHNVAAFLDANLDDDGEVFPMAFFSSGFFGNYFGIWCGGGDKFVDGYVYVVPRYVYPGYFDDGDSFPPWEYFIAGYSLQDFFDNLELDRI